MAFITARFFNLIELIQNKININIETINIINNNTDNNYF